MSKMSYEVWWIVASGHTFHSASANEVGKIFEIDPKQFRQEIKARKTEGLRSAWICGFPFLFQPPRIWDRTRKATSVKSPDQIKPIVRRFVTHSLGRNQL